MRSNPHRFRAVLLNSLACPTSGRRFVGWRLYRSCLEEWICPNGSAALFLWTGQGRSPTIASGKNYSAR